MKKRMIIYAAIVLLVYVALGLFFFFKQKGMIYFPTPDFRHSYTEEIIQNDGERIKVILLNPGKRSAIIYFGGNGEAVVYNANEFLTDFPEHTVYLFNYRGYGGSSGEPSEKGIFSDALALYDQIEARHESISAIGRSLGSAVAVYLAAERRVDKLVLVTAFDSVLNIARRILPLHPVRLLLRDHYNSISRVEQISAPVLIIRAENDEHIAEARTLNLMKAFPEEQVTYITIMDSGHNTISGYSEYHSQLRAFFEQE